MKRSPKGRLELTWMGKDSVLIPSEEGKYDYAFVDPDDPRAREVKSIEVLEQVGELGGPTGANENLLIIGDSGDALRSLATIPEYHDKYAGQVKLVYIDPPFNTEQTFEHYADQLEHSIWLTMMRDRLRDLRPLLAEEASIWVHLDDAEVHRMRGLLDEEFGPENFVATVVWQKAYAPRNDASAFSTDQDYILVYSTGPGWSTNRLPRKASRDALYDSPDGDPRPWISDNPAAPGANRGARQHPGVYGIQNPVTGEMVYPSRGRVWSNAQPTIIEWLAETAKYVVAQPDLQARSAATGIPLARLRSDVYDLVLGGPLLDGKRDIYEGRPLPRLYFTRGGTGALKLKKYLDEIGDGRAPQTLWLAEEVGHNRSAKHEIGLLFPGRTPFATPKPEALLQQVLKVGSREGDLVLDFFAGSGTTAAVAHKMRRRWITVELLPDTAHDFIIPRLRMVVGGEDQGGISKESTRVASGSLPSGMTPDDAQQFNTYLSKVVRDLKGLNKDTIGELRRATRTRTEASRQWAKGGGFSVAMIGPSMYEVDDEDGEVYLSPEATNGAWSKAVAGQLKFTLTPDHPVFAGVRKRQCLAVIDGLADETVVRTVVEALGERERAVIVSKGVLPEAAELLSTLSPGSRIRKAPEDIFPKGTVN